MAIYYARFEHVCAEDGCGLDELMAFMDLNLPTEEGVMEKFKENFEKLFDGEYGEYNRSYKLKEIGSVIVDNGYMIETIE